MPVRRSDERARRLHDDGRRKELSQCQPIAPGATPMKPPRESPGWPPHWHLEDQSSVHVMLGRVLERTETTVSLIGDLQQDVRTITTRLANGDRRMDHLQRAVEKQAKAPKPETLMPGWERLVKAVLPYLIVPFAAWATGSWQLALDIARALSGK